MAGKTAKKTSSRPKDLIYHVDDSFTALHLVKDLIITTFPHTELKQFSRASEAISSMREEPTPPWIMICDYNMPGMNGMDVLDQIKRNPTLHFTPIVFLTAEQDEKQIAKAKEHGVFSYIVKPIKRPALQAVFQKRESELVEYSKLQEMDRIFADEISETVEQLTKVIENFDDESIKQIFRSFHALKGNAISLQFPHLASFLHLSEDFLNVIQQTHPGHANSHASVFSSIFSYLGQQAEEIKAEKILSNPPQDLSTKLELYKANLAAGISIIPLSPAQQVHSVSQKKPQSTETAIVGNITYRTSSSLRISNETLDQLQHLFKRIFHHKTKLGSFTNKLIQEFPEEHFPKEIAKILEEFHGDAIQVMDFFIHLRVVPIGRLKIACTNTISQVSSKLDKSVNFEFLGETSLEVDRDVVECLETSLKHLINNSIDHGIEPSGLRTAIGKSPEGKIHIIIQSQNQDTLSVKFEDDGGGINPSTVREVVAKKGIMSAEKVNILNDQESIELIFYDGISTKSQVSELSGRGVGLSAVRQAIEKLGGKIDVTSQMGKGTKFDISIPRFFKL